MSQSDPSTSAGCRICAIHVEALERIAVGDTPAAKIAREALLQSGVWAPLPRHQWQHLLHYSLEFAAAGLEVKQIESVQSRDAYLDSTECAELLRRAHSEATHQNPVHALMVATAMEFAADVIELYDDATIQHGHMLDAKECAGVLRELEGYIFLREDRFALL